MVPTKLQGELDSLYTTDEYGTRFISLSAKPSDTLVSYFKEKHNIRTDVHRMCLNCQIRQIAKYEDARVEDFDPKRFEPRCTFVPDGLPPGSMQQVMRIATEKSIEIEQAKKIVLATIDPVAWAELMFGFRDDDPKWHLRSYQKEQLRCTAERMVLREGRRSGKTFIMALKLIYLALTMKVRRGVNLETGREEFTGPQIMIVTPFQSQIDNIFEEMEKLLKKSYLPKEVKLVAKGSLFVKTPFYSMEFHNGATISGFVSGVGQKADGSGGGTMRGETAQVVYLDEMDMISETVLEKVITPLLLSDDGVRLYGTSTPIGKRGVFYRWCLERPDFKEYHLPSTLLPTWQKIKREVLGDASEETLKAEYLALFVDGSFGVFKPSMVHGARREYRYDDTAKFEFWSDKAQDRSAIIYTIGIDWNKNAGTEFYVMAFDQMTGIFWGVEATNISSSEFSAENWKEELKRLNYKWRPDYIYADEGYGHTIIEDLRLEAHRLRGAKKLNDFDSQTVQLLDRLVSFNFSSKIEIRDPVTSQVISKPAKFYLVETAIRVFETDRIRYPESDAVLIKQLLEYAVLRISDVTGKPVYGPTSDKIGDHRLDAMMLAVVAVYLQRSVYAKNMMVGSVPAVFSREHLQERSEPASQKLDLPGALNLIRGGTPQDDRLARERVHAKEQLALGRRPKGSRSDITGTTNQPGPVPASAYRRDDEDLHRYREITTAGMVRKNRSRPKQSRRL